MSDDECVITGVTKGDGSAEGISALIPKSPKRQGHGNGTGFIGSESETPPKLARNVTMCEHGLVVGECAACDAMGAQAVGNHGGACGGLVGSDSEAVAPPPGPGASSGSSAGVRVVPALPLLDDGGDGSDASSIVDMTVNKSDGNNNEGSDSDDGILQPDIVPAWMNAHQSSRAVGGASSTSATGHPVSTATTATRASASAAHALLALLADAGKSGGTSGSELGAESRDGAVAMGMSAHSAPGGSRAAVGGPSIASASGVPAAAGASVDAVARSGSAEASVRPGGETGRSDLSAMAQGLPNCMKVLMEQNESFRRIIEQALRCEPSHEVELGDIASFAAEEAGLRAAASAAYLAASANDLRALHPVRGGARSAIEAISGYLESVSAALDVKHTSKAHSDLREMMTWRGHCLKIPDGLKERLKGQLEERLATFAIGVAVADRQDGVAILRRILASATAELFDGLSNAAATHFLSVACAEQLTAVSHVVRAISVGDSYFTHGGPGSGKSVILQMGCLYASAVNAKMKIISVVRKSARRISPKLGNTAHKLLGLGMMNRPVAAYVQKYNQTPLMQKLYDAPGGLVIFFTEMEQAGVVKIKLIIEFFAAIGVNAIFIAEGDSGQIMSLEGGRRTNQDDDGEFFYGSALFENLFGGNHMELVENHRHRSRPDFQTFLRVVREDRLHDVSTGSRAVVVFAVFIDVQIATVLSRNV